MKCVLLEAVIDVSALRVRAFEDRRGHAADHATGVVGQPLQLAHLVVAHVDDVLVPNRANFERCDVALPREPADALEVLRELIGDNTYRKGSHGGSSVPEAAYQLMTAKLGKIWGVSPSYARG